MIPYLIAIISLMLSLYACLRLRKLYRISNSNIERLYRLANQAQIALDKVRQDIQRVEHEMMRQNGALHIHPDMTIAEALKIEPGVSKVMAAFHIGGCSSCSVSEHESIAEAAASYGVDIMEFMNTLHRYMKDPASFDKELDDRHSHSAQPQLVQIGGTRG